MYNIWYLGIASAAISFTISTTSIFNKLREYIGSWGPKWEQWINCPWCLGFYTSATMVFLSLDSNPEISNPIDFLIYTFAIMGIGGLVHYVLLRAYKPVAEKMARIQMMKLRNKNKAKVEIEDPTETFY